MVDGVAVPDSGIDGVLDPDSSGDDSDPLSDMVMIFFICSLSVRILLLPIT